MARYTIHFSCGHTEERQLFGKEDDRQRKIKYFQEQGLCSKCWEERKQLEYEKKKEAEKKIADDMDKKYNLPSLEGSEKQIAWARTIRGGLVEYVDKKLIEFSENSDAVKYLTLFIEKLKGYKEAKFWIEKRNDTIEMYNEYIIEISKQLKQNK